MPRKTATATETAVDPGVIMQLDPATVLADDNTRYNLKESRIQTLAESIVAQGGVIEPVEVEPIPEPTNGFLYRLNMGFYRHAAVKFLNTTQAAGLTLPAVLHVTANPTERLMRQLAENIERENQSPMDNAIAIKRLFDAGVSRMDIRQMFSRPGTKKGKPEPASNSWVNMTLSFLELPKSIQEKIHVGTLGVRSAYEVTKAVPEKRATVLERAEELRKKELEEEQKDEEKFLAAEKRSVEQQAKLDKVKAEFEAAETKFKQANEQLERQTSLVTDLFAKSKAKYDTPKDKKAADTAFKEAEKQRTVAEADATEAQKEYEKAQVAFSKLTEPKAVKKEAAKKQSVTAQQVRQAAKETGAATGAVPLTGAEMRKVIIEMCLPGGSEALIAIGKAIQQCFLGVTTPDQLFKEMEKIIK